MYYEIGVIRLIHPLVIIFKSTHYINTLFCVLTKLSVQCLKLSQIKIIRYLSKVYFTFNLISKEFASKSDEYTIHFSCKVVDLDNVTR